MALLSVSLAALSLMGFGVTVDAPFARKVFILASIGLTMGFWTLLTGISGGCRRKPLWWWCTSLSLVYTAHYGAKMVLYDLLG